MLITFGEILEVGIKRLEQAEIMDAKRDAELLLMFLMNESGNFLFTHKNHGTDESHADAYFELVDRRAGREPLQYIVGSQEFMGLKFKVDRSVLIPRQDTETLVELALERSREKKANISILDMCCGSGAIGISMAHFLPKAKITACDISDEALEIARINAAENGVEKRMEFIKSDMFNTINKRDKEKPLKGRFDMILCNPPYIPSDIVVKLQKEIREYEPLVALNGGEDGLDFYRIIASDAQRNLKVGGLLMMEIGHDQADEVTGLLKETGKYGDIRVDKDLPGMDRVVSCALLKDK